MGCRERWKSLLWTVMLSCRKAPTLKTPLSACRIPCTPDLFRTCAKVSIKIRKILINIDGLSSQIKAPNAVAL